jgi:hypothetical protein
MKQVKIKFQYIKKLIKSKLHLSIFLLAVLKATKEVLVQAIYKEEQVQDLIVFNKTSNNLKIMICTSKKLTMHHRETG